MYSYTYFILIIKETNELLDRKDGKTHDRMLPTMATGGHKNKRTRQRTLKEQILKTIKSKLTLNQNPRNPKRKKRMILMSFYTSFDLYLECNFAQCIMHPDLYLKIQHAQAA